MLTEFFIHIASSAWKCKFDLPHAQLKQDFQFIPIFIILVIPKLETMKNNILFTIVLILLSFVSNADDITWTGAAGDNIWENPENWNTNSVPTGNDHVTIPEGTPDCKVMGDLMVVNTIKNYGNLEITGGSPHLNSFQNYHNLVLTRFSSYSSVSFTRSEMTFENTGRITTNGYCEFIVEGTGASFSNYGEINVSHFNADVENFENGGTGELYSSIGHLSDYFEINCTENFSNNGRIEGRTSTHQYGTSVKINAKVIENNGKILGGNNNMGYTGKRAGDIELNANRIENSKYGEIRSGSGQNGDYHGKIRINTHRNNNKGTIAAGRSSDKSSADNTTDEIYFNDVSIAADSIIIKGDSAMIEGDSINFIFNYMKVSDIENLASIYADRMIFFRGTQNAIFDFSQNVGMDIIFNNIHDSSIYIYCDNLVTPPEGLNWPFSPYPIVFGSDLSYINAYMSSDVVSDSAGSNGNFRIILQNQSTASRSFDYSVTSSKGWIIPSSGSTLLLEPFDFDTLIIEYNIPLNADTMIDTITQLLEVPDVFSTTSFSYIQSSIGTIVGMYEQQIQDYGQLYQNYPNPFNRETIIGFHIDKEAFVTIKVFDHTGREIAVLAETYYSPGRHQVIFHASCLTPGMYIYTIQVNDIYMARKMMIIR